MAYQKLKYWFDSKMVEDLSQEIKLRIPLFNTQLFIDSVKTNLDTLELKPRIELIADCIEESMDCNYSKSITGLIKVLGPENKLDTGMFANYYWILPIAKYVEKYGLNDFDISMIAIEEITKRSTSEYAIRPFLEKYQDRAFSVMLKWSLDSNFHVRRLACEGMRPRLPWALKMNQFINDPSPIIPILNNLKDDKSKYVQKSVANCINDILKDNYEIGKRLIEDWNNLKISNERKWIIKHSLRRLIKTKDSWAAAMVAKLQA